jgi:hypothetical protein
MTHLELIELLYEKGFTFGWTLTGDLITLWEHDQDPPAPLERPNETPSANA